MIKVQITGGLGNQMFQYAVARNLALKNKTKVVVDTISLQHDIKLSKQYSFRDYKLDVYKIKASKSYLSNYLNVIYIRNIVYLFQTILNKIGVYLLDNHFVKEKGPFAFDSTILEKNSSLYLIGYFQTEKYFTDIRNIILDDFSLIKPLSSKAREWEEKIKNSPISISIHIRRGDYVDSDYHALQNLDYYDNAIEIIKKQTGNGVFLFVFSDDIAWVKQNIKTKDTIFFVSSPQIKDFEEMYLISICKHNIIANSSFSWWGAWLNKNSNKVIVAPKKWVVDPSVDTKDICPSSWVRI